MPSYARKEIVADGELGIYHCVNRCVRRAWLCGKDPVSGTSYDHRKDWIQDRLEELAGIFAVDILWFAVMANHVHVVVRARPDVGTHWSPDEIEGDPAEPARRNQARRASNRGFLSMRLEDYLKILDWTGRQVRRDQQGSIPPDVAPILDRLGLSDESWLDCVKNFGRWFHRAAGHVSALSSEAARAGKHWLQGVARCGEAFA